MPILRVSGRGSKQALYLLLCHARRPQSRLVMRVIEPCGRMSSRVIRVAPPKVRRVSFVRLVAAVRSVSSLSGGVSSSESTSCRGVFALVLPSALHTSRNPSPLLPCGDEIAKLITRDVISTHWAAVPNPLVLYAISAVAGIHLAMVVLAGFAARPHPPGDV